MFDGILVSSAQSKGAASESELAVVFACAFCSDRVFWCSRQELCCSQDRTSNTLKLSAATENDSNISRVGS